MKAHYSEWQISDNMLQVTDLTFSSLSSMCICLQSKTISSHLNDVSGMGMKGWISNVVCKKRESAFVFLFVCFQKYKKGQKSFYSLNVKSTVFKSK